MLFWHTFAFLDYTHFFHNHLPYTTRMVEVIACSCVHHWSKNDVANFGGQTVTDREIASFCFLDSSKGDLVYWRTQFSKPTAIPLTTTLSLGCLSLNCMDEELCIESWNNDTQLVIPVKQSKIWLNLCPKFHDHNRNIDIFLASL